MGEVPDCRDFAGYFGGDARARLGVYLRPIPVSGVGCKVSEFYPDDDEPESAAEAIIFISALIAVGIIAVVAGVLWLVR